MFKKKISVPVDFKPGLVESPPDERDYALSSVSPVIQRYPEVCPAPFDLTINNQEAEPSCVGQSASTMKQEKELREKVTKVFDGSWLYKECKKIDGMPSVEGTFLRCAFDILKKLGAKPINENDPSPYKIQMYARVDDLSFEGLKKAIFLHGTIQAGFTGSNPGWQGEVVRPPKAGEAMWNHAVALIGYEKDYIIGQNSWGENAHKKGLFKIPKTYIPFEAWAIVIDSPNDIVPQPIQQTGWVAVNYLKTTDGITRTTANVNLRKDPGTNKPILKTIPVNTIVNLTPNSSKVADGYIWREIYAN